MEEMRLAQLTKEMVAEEHRRGGDALNTAARVVRQVLAAAFSSRLPEGTTADVLILDTVQGAMAALLIADQDMAQGALAIVEAILQTAAEFELDPTESMRCALRALADLRRFVDPSRIVEIRHAIDSHYMGAGEVFIEYLKQPLPELSAEELQRTSVKI